MRNSNQFSGTSSHSRSSVATNNLNNKKAIRGGQNEDLSDSEAASPLIGISSSDKKSTSSALLSNRLAFNKSERFRKAGK